MYDLNNINIGPSLRAFRKNAHKSLLDVGIAVNKSKATISKYEKDEIIPDYITLIELCNYLNISLDELFPIYERNKKMQLNNPFNCNKLYLYYYTDNKLITSVLILNTSNNSNKSIFYNGVKNLDNYMKCSYYYEGTFDCNKTTVYFSFMNSNVVEKVQIIINLPWTNEISVCKGLILGLTPNSLPIVKKVCISKSPIKNIEKYNDFIVFSKEDVKKIYYDGALIIENKNYDEFLF